MFMLQQPVRTFIILIKVRSPGFGSNFRYLSLLHDCFNYSNWFDQIEYLENKPKKLTEQDLKHLSSPFY